MLFRLLSCCNVILLASASLTADELRVFRDNDFTVEERENSWVLSHSGIPEHGFEGGFGNNPNTPSVQNHSYEIPKSPTSVEDDSVGCVRLGPIAMSISGVPFYNPYTGGGYNAVEGDCQETFDHCDGHPSRDGAYHYHQLPTCLYYNSSDLRDVFLGVAFDGYPIYGPMNEAYQNVTSAELDKCHGHVYKGRYIYRVTFDFPYIMACYRGSLLFTQGPPGGTGGGMGPGTGGRPPRQKRDVTQNEHRYMYKRQLITSNCNTAQEPTWMAETCWAFCENPGTGAFDNCNPNGEGTTTEGTTDAGLRMLASTWMTTIFVLFIICICKLL